MMKCTKPEGCFNWLWRGKEEKRKRLKFWLLRRKKKEMTWGYVSILILHQK